MKRGISKFFSILLVLCMVFSMVPVAALAASQPSVLYLKPNSNWLSDGARFAAYFFSDSGDTWVSMSDSDGDGIYEANVPVGYSSVIFCRMNPSDSSNNWNNKWNQTSDLSIPTDGTNCYAVADGTWDSGGGTWSTVNNDVEAEYYLFGFINGANYGCEEDSDNLGSYKFSGGKLTVTFSSDSYIGVKTNTDNWYMTNSYVDTTSATLYNTSTGSSEKMFVPGGVKVTFTLTVNSNDTLKLSYSVDSSTCAHTSHNTSGLCTACGTLVSHSFSGGSCTVCGTTCDHSWSNGSCKNCGASCTHSWSGATCSICKMTCSHSWSNGTCTNCGTKCGHKWQSGKCAVCGISCSHSYVDGACSTCGWTCSHSWSNGTCKTCGINCTHSYSNGTCTTCGSAEPVIDYYLFGYINGANYGCEEDYATLGAYKFSSGKVTATFETDSYVGVKTGDNSTWYMTNGWLGEVNSATLYNTNSISDVNKLYVPGGVKVTFTLTVNSNDTVKLSYSVDASTCSHIAHNESGVCKACGTSVGHSYSNSVCTGCGAACTHSWSGNTCTICGATGSVNSVKIHFSNTLGWNGVVAYAWSVKGTTNTALNEWPGVIVNRDDDGYYTLDLAYQPVSGESLGLLFHNFAGSQTADIIVDYASLSASGEVWVKPNTYTNADNKYECAVSTVKSNLVVSPEISGTKVTFRYENSSASNVYVAGSFNDWSTSANKMTYSNGVWSTTLTLAEGAYEYKFVVDGEWIHDPNNGVVGGYEGNSVVVVGGSSTDKVTIVFHFFRDGENAYDDWDVWFWDTQSSGSGTFSSVSGDKGMVCTYTLDGTANTSVGYTVRKTDWSDQEFYDRFIDLSDVESGTVHFYLNSGSATGSRILANDVVMSSSATYANLDYESGKIWVKTSMPVTNPLSTFAITDAYGNASDISITGVTLDNWGYSLTLSRKLMAHEVGNYRVNCDGLMYIKTEGMFYSNQFAADYTYHGNDLGATWSSTKTTFKVWAPTAQNVQIQLYSGGNYGVSDWIKTVNMTRGDLGVWSASVSGNLHGKYYVYTVDFGHYTTEAVDPYAKSTGANGDRGMILNMDATDPDGWTNDVSPNKGMNYTDAIIYEMHIREMTIDSTSGVKDEWKGKFLGMTQTGTNYEGRATALDHLKELGITHVQLMPAYDFSSNDEYHLEDWEQYNWGYDPEHYNVPEGSYATDPFNGDIRVNEFKQMVQTFHSNGINVVMDVVYNHTYSGGDWCYNKIVPNYFSRFWGEGNWSNGSGCGNDVATERSMARNYIIDSMLYWVEEYHIDGFRFDYASLIDTQTMNDIISTIQAKYPYVIFYGEGWNKDGATAVEDGYSLANQGNAWITGSLAFYNDKIRNAIAGDNGHSWGFATGDTGKADDIANSFRASNGWSSSPSQTINYVSAHDNHTLIDKIIISRNGAYWEEMVRMNNLSAAIYMMAQGIPYIYSGEELLREKVNEDGYRIDNAHGTNDYVNKIRWDHLVNKDYAQMTDDYYAGLVAFRKNHAALRCPDGSNAWNYTSYYKINDQCIMFYVSGYPNYECSDGIAIIYNASNNTQWVNLGDYGLPWGYYQACVHGTQAGITPLWGVDVGGSGTGSVGVEGISTTILVLGDLVHEESVYNNQNYSCSHASHTTSGLCTTCGVDVGHSYSSGTCSVCGRSESAAESVTLYFDNSSYNWSGVYCYSWATAGGKNTEYTGSWPGSQMTEVGNGIYALTVSTNATNIIFNDALGNQTDALAMPTDLTKTQYNPSTGQWVAYTAPVKNYYITGTMNDWSLNDSAYLLTSDGLTYSKTFTWTAGSYEFKVCDGSWDNAWPSSNYVLNLDVKSEVTISFDPSSGNIDVTTTALETPTCTHSYTSKVTTAGTCTTNGVKTFTCSKCGDSYTQSIAATGHSYSSQVTTAATCTAAGVKTYTCSTCSNSYTESISATGHSYSAGTCTNCGALDPNYVVTDTGYVQVTSLSDITKGGNFVLVAQIDGGYKALGTTLSSGKFVGVDVSVSNRVVTGSSLPVWTIAAIDGGITLSVGGSYLNYNTSTNFKMATDAYVWTVTEGDSGFIFNASAATRGIYYQISSAKFGAYSQSYVSSSSYVSNLLVFKYQVGSQGCSHSYSSKVTTAATCTQSGVRTYTCNLCSASYTETIAATGHSYSGGSCTVCGAADPSASTTTDYYLFGYINGANYGCEEDWENLGQYKFVNGKLTATFASDSYVAVKTGDNTGWYMFQSYVDTTSGTLYNTNAGGNEKMFIPGNTEVTFTLVVNSDDTMTLSYTAASTGCSHSYSNGYCTSCGAADPNYVAPSGSYVQVTDVSQITSGGQFVIVALVDGAYKAMGTTLSSGKFSGTDVTVSGNIVTGSDLPVWTIETVDGGVALSVDGSYLNYNSSTNFKFADAAYTWTVTAGDSGFIFNSALTTRGIYYQLSSAKFGAYASSNSTSASYVSNLMVFKYGTGSSSVTKPTLTLKNPTLAFEDEILYNVYYTADNTSSVTEMGLATFATRDTAGTVATAQETISGYVSNSDGTYTVHSNGVPAKMLSDALYFKVYAKLTDGSYVYSDIAGYHAVAYANTILNSTTASDQAKSLVVAMLNYGAAAQTNFDYKATALMNASLTSAQKALVSAYSDSMVATVPSVSTTKAGSFVNNSGYSDVHPTVSFEGAFSINYYFTPKYTPASGITFYYWNLSDFNANSTLKTTNATGSVNMTSTDGSYTAAIEGIAAKAIDEPVFIAAVYTNGGTSYYTPVIGYSLGAYCKNLAANGNDFGAATAVYGYYAKAYFAS